MKKEKDYVKREREKKKKRSFAGVVSMIIGYTMDATLGSLSLSLGQSQS